jgi:hypothetical protein
MYQVLKVFREQNMPFIDRRLMCFLEGQRVYGFEYPILEVEFVKLFVFSFV